MVFYFRCFSFSSKDEQEQEHGEQGEEEEEEEHHDEEIQDDAITQTISTTSQSYYYTARTDSNSYISESHKLDFLNLTHKPSNLRIFTLDELQEATTNFCLSSKINENGIWEVHRGVVRSSEYPFNEIQVAVKRAKERWLGHKQQWLTEINILGLVKHPNLVSLVGYCIEDDVRFLVYEYMSNRSVYDHLNKSLETPLSWTVRLKVAQDVARGLAYLHEGIDFGIKFGDFKSSIVLLDDQWNAKLSDFGLTRLRLQGFQPIRITTGYEAIEYMATGSLAVESDVWSYGVFLYEVISGRHPLDRKQSNNLQLLERLKQFLRSKNVKLQIDPRLECNYSLEMAQALAIIAKRCLSKNPKTRPKMSEVLEMVNKLTLVVPSQSTTPERSLKSKKCLVSCCNPLKKSFYMYHQSVKKPKL